MIAWFAYTVAFEWPAGTARSDVGLASLNERGQNGS